MSKALNPDWAGSVTNIKSTMHYCMLVWGNLVTWRSKKQSIIARISVEARRQNIDRWLMELQARTSLGRTKRICDYIYEVVL